MLKQFVTAGLACAIVFVDFAMAAPVRNDAADLVGLGATADSLVAIEASRQAIVARIVADQAASLAASGVPVDAFRAALMELRADQLLAASLVDSLEDISAIVAQQPILGPALRHYVPIVPRVVRSAVDLPAAAAFLTRSTDELRIVRPGELTFDPAVEVVGYFELPASVMAVSIGPMARKDGSGSGANSWIGYVAGGNVASGSGSAVAAGTYNAATGQNAFVGAGQSNSADGTSSLVIGGFDNHAIAIDSVVVAGAGNQATGARSVVVGGGYNVARGQWSFIGGGGRQAGSGAPGTSPQDNVATGDFAVLGGGFANRVGSTGQDAFSTIAGGNNNVVAGAYATIGGGAGNVAGYNATVAGGGLSPLQTFPNLGNYAMGAQSSIGGGYGNRATGWSATVPGGRFNTASGDGSTAMGIGNVANGLGSLALGNSAATQSAGAAPHDGAFAFSDGSRGTFRSLGSNTFNVLATGGVRFVTAATQVGNEASPDKYVDIVSDGRVRFSTGDTTKLTLDDVITSRAIGVQPSTVYQRTDGGFAWYLRGVESSTQNDPGSGGSVLATLTDTATTTAVTGTFRALAFTATSDRNQKTAFVELDPRLILAKVAELPVMAWSYKSEVDRGIRHIGPVSQDFMRLFAVGYDDQSITTVDADGVALAAIKALKQASDQREGEIARLREELGALRAEVRAMTQSRRATRQ